MTKHLVVNFCLTILLVFILPVYCFLKHDAMFGIEDQVHRKMQQYYDGISENIG